MTVSVCKSASVEMIQIRPGSKLPVGLDSFRCVVLQDYTFVDKSLLIQEFIAASDLVSLVLRPRRFGKSMNLDMLRHSFLLSHSRYFFEKVPAETPDTWCNRRDLFNGLLIETQFPELFDAHFAKYPCIHFSMKVPTSFLSHHNSGFQGNLLAADVSRD